MRHNNKFIYNKATQFYVYLLVRIKVNKLREGTSTKYINLDCLTWVAEIAKCRLIFENITIVHCFNYTRNDDALHHSNIYLFCGRYLTFKGLFLFAPILLLTLVCYCRVMPHIQGDAYHYINLRGLLYTYRVFIFDRYIGKILTRKISF